MWVCLSSGAARTRGSHWLSMHASSRLRALGRVAGTHCAEGGRTSRHGSRAGSASSASARAKAARQQLNRRVIAAQPTGHSRRDRTRICHPPSWVMRGTGSSCGGRWCAGGTTACHAAVPSRWRRRDLAELASRWFLNGGGRRRAARLEFEPPTSGAQRPDTAHWRTIELVRAQPTIGHVYSAQDGRKVVSRQPRATRRRAWQSAGRP